MSAKRRSRRNSKKSMIFSAWNYKVLIAGLLLVVIGFTAMYIDNTIHGFVALYISPVLILAGYVTVIFSIMKHGKQSNGKSTSS